VLDSPGMTRDEFLDFVGQHADIDALNEIDIDELVSWFDWKS
jgi:hypothetical protein